ncbi:MAG: DUF2075 domain-containing protein [Phycisphaerales bacterium]|jgi:hypothetical protein|nr:DUF2075 domain-containing protein [Phycisphaerales bacterium]
MSAYLRNTIPEFLATSEENLVGVLTTQTTSHELKIDQATEWQETTNLLKSALGDICDRFDQAKSWGILLEYTIPLRQKRIDAVVLARDLIFVIEFKASNTHDAYARRQVEDYALDLRDFHAESNGRVIIPILVARTAEMESKHTSRTTEDAVRNVVLADATNLASTMLAAFTQNSLPDRTPIDHEAWDNSQHQPIPTIIEAAQALYGGNSVEDIQHSHADAHNLSTTTQCLVSAIRYARDNQRKVICFVTGVPGSGKTLTGLNAVHTPELLDGSKSIGAFLSGNVPLVKIVSEALARDQRDTRGVSLKDARREVNTFIQNVHVFMDFYGKDQPDQAPCGNVVVFDEAQRAWDAKKAQKKWARETSEPEMMFQIMDRHDDWAVIIALVGGGQEIYEGEAGLAEWGHAMSKGYSHWEARVSPQVVCGGVSVAGSKLFEDRIPEEITVIEEDALHLAVSVRACKARNVAKWVNTMLQGDSTSAKKIMSTIGDFPILLTRELSAMRNWLRNTTRGIRRCGLVASSGALRLRAHGLEVSSGFHRGYPTEHWFLGPRTDIRSSYQLEVAVREFECQGLELDRVGICWGSDFTRNITNGSWRHRQFKGAKWQNIKKEKNQDYLLNKYRVLLTRARGGMVLWIPHGDSNDPTRDPKILNDTADYLRACGVKELSQ